MAFVARERLRGTMTAPPIPECTNAFQGSPTLTAAKGGDEDSNVPGDWTQTLGDVSAGNDYDHAGDGYEDYHYEDAGYDNEDELHGEEEAYNMLLVRTGRGGSSSYVERYSYYRLTKSKTKVSCVVAMLFQSISVKGVI